MQYHNKHNPAQNHPNSQNERNTDSHIIIAQNSDISESNNKLEPMATNILNAMNSSSTNDINSKLQNKGIGVTGKKFNIQIQILLHTLRKVTVLLNDSTMLIDDN
jgi:hypothetical protein